MAIIGDVPVFVGRPDQHAAAIEPGQRIERRVGADAEVVVQRAADVAIESAVQRGVVEPAIDQHHQLPDFIAQSRVQRCLLAKPLENAQSLGVVLGIARLADQVSDRLRPRRAWNKPHEHGHNDKD
jgi:hypothetical protein